MTGVQTCALPIYGGFWFEPMHIEWDVKQIRKALVRPVDLLGDRLLWATSSHDMPRSPTRLGGGDLGRARTLALNVLFSCLPDTLHHAYWYLFSPDAHDHNSVES